MVREASSVAIEALPSRSTTAAVAAGADTTRIAHETTMRVVKRRWRESSRPARKSLEIEHSSNRRMAPLSDCPLRRDNSIQALTVGWHLKLSRPSETTHKGEM